MEITRTLRIFACLLGIFFMAAPIMQAQNATLSVQGVLKKFDGSAVDDGEYNLTFTLWKTASGSSASDKVWFETIADVETRGGVYSVVLGDNGTALDAPFDQVYYLGVKIGSGQELSPRPLLTHAPYALSLLGLTNTFPSTGTVIADGISVSGDVSVDEDVSVSGNLSVSTGNVFIGNSSNAKLNIRSTDSVATVPILNVQTESGANVFFVRNDGRVNIGAAADLSNNALLTISDWDPIRYDPETFNLPVFQPATSYGPISIINNLPDPLLSTPVSIFAARSVVAENFIAFSDARIKDIIGRTNNAEDLRTIQQINITDYTHIDKIAKGNRAYKKVIAQELEAVYPTAVSTITEVVPDLYQFANIQNGRVEIKNNLKPGELVQLIFGSEKQIVEVLAADATGFQVPLQREGKVFVYGRQVNDFHMVDYEALSTLNISATQELARRLELLEAENAALKHQLEASTQVLEAFSKRLEAVEASRTNTGGVK